MSMDRTIYEEPTYTKVAPTPEDLAAAARDVPAWFKRWAGPDFVDLEDAPPTLEPDEIRSRIDALPFIAPRATARPSLLARIRAWIGGAA